jgi:mono/diheme cytochrome c family protein
MRSMIAILALAVLASAAQAQKPAKAKTGPEVFATCVTCHQATGLGMPGAFPPLAGSEWALGNPDLPIAIVLHGLQGEVTVKGQKYQSMMTAWGPMFSDEEVANVLTYVRSQWGNKASPVTAAQVAKVRAATKARTAPWTAAEVLKQYPR